jgi:hypothetical protein
MLKEKEKMAQRSMTSPIQPLQASSRQIAEL